MEVPLIVISSLTLASSIIAPLIIAGASFINRIRKSDCCGGHVELDAPKSSPKLEPETKPELQPVPSTLNKLVNFLKLNK